MRIPSWGTLYTNTVNLHRLTSGSAGLLNSAATTLELTSSSRPALNCSHRALGTLGGLNSFF